MVFQKGHPQSNTGRTHFQKGNHPMNSGRTYFQKGHTGYWKGKHQTPESNIKRSIKLKGHTHGFQKGHTYNAGDKNPMKRPEVRVKVSITQKGKHYSPQTEYKCGEKNRNWNNGSSFEPYGTDFNSTLKEQIRARDGYRCQECFRHQSELRTKSNKPRKLMIHHIDYDKKHNKLENLISLCPSCHAQTNFDRQDWTNFSRKYIKK